MHSNSPLHLLIIPISELPFSESFHLRAKLMGFFNIGDILDFGVGKLHTLDDYCESWYAELTAYLERHGLLYLLDA